MMPLGAAIGFEAKAQKNLPAPGERRNLSSVAKYLVANQGFVCAPRNCATGLLRHILRRATLAIYTHSIRRTHDDADKIAVLAGLAPAPKIPGNKLETSSSVEPQESVVSDCFIGSRGWSSIR